jgi:hypothetical protein
MGYLGFFYVEAKSCELRYEEKRRPLFCREEQRYLSWGDIGQTEHEVAANNGGGVDKWREFE